MSLESFIHSFQIDRHSYLLLFLSPDSDLLMTIINLLWTSGTLCEVVHNTPPNCSSKQTLTTNATRAVEDVPPILDGSVFNIPNMNKFFGGSLSEQGKVYCQFSFSFNRALILFIEDCPEQRDLRAILSLYEQTCLQHIKSLQAKQRYKQSFKFLPS